MPDRLDGFLSGKAQSVWRTALVYQKPSGNFELHRQDEEPIIIGTTFKESRMALYALIRAARRTADGGSKA